MQTTPQDALLAVRCRLGEPSALDELVDRWHGPLRAYVGRLLSGTDGLDETLQELWLRILRGLPGLRDPHKLVPWMYRIARFAAMDHLRGRYASAGEEVEPDALPSEEAESSQELHLELRELEAALDRLAWPERETVVLFYLEGWSTADIAELVGIPVGTVKSRLFRARKELEKILRPGPAAHE